MIKGDWVGIIGEVGLSVGFLECLRDTVEVAFWRDLKPANHYEGALC